MDQGRSASEGGALAETGGFAGGMPHIGGVRSPSYDDAPARCDRNDETVGQGGERAGEGTSGRSQWRHKQQVRGTLPEELERHNKSSKAVLKVVALFFMSCGVLIHTIHISTPTIVTHYHHTSSPPKKAADWSTRRTARHTRNVRPFRLDGREIEVEVTETGRALTASTPSRSQKSGRWWHWEVWFTEK